MPEQRRTRPARAGESTPTMPEMPPRTVPVTGVVDGADSRFTFIELLIVIGIISLLMSMLLPVLAQARQWAQIVRAKVEIRGVLQAIEMYKMENSDAPPLYMAQILVPAPVDPWDMCYVYNHFDVIPPGKRRKDHNLVPINTVFDLYSSGPDRRSAPPLVAGPSRDDIVVADDGAFIGIAEDY